MSESNAKFNLIDEPWISVVTDYKGQTKLVGLKEFFENAHNYIVLAGDMPTQDFAVMRFLLAILHTVFSRYDANGNPYEMIELNDRMQQTMEVYEEDEEEYEDALMDTWKDLWTAGKFPEIVVEYLEKWHDRFYLFHDKYPFYQVTKDIMGGIYEKLIDVKYDKAMIYPKLINRIISESGNKEVLFLSKTNKDELSNDELARWLITFQGVSNASDKRSINKIKGKSIGWINHLGGIFVSSDNIFKTLMLNLVLNNNDEYSKIQKPCWEQSLDDLYNKYFNNDSISNISELYTNWSRFIYYTTITPKIKNKSCEVFGRIDKDVKKPKSYKVFRIIKTNTIKDEDQLMEPMTIWGELKGKKYYTQKHEIYKSSWRNFALINNVVNENYKKPGVIDHINNLNKFIKDYNNIDLNFISTVYDDNSSSRAMTNEIYDNLKLNFYVLTDILENGWVHNINNVVSRTEEAIAKIYKSFIKGIVVIRKGESDKSISSLVDKKVEKMFYKIDKPFRDWLSRIEFNDSKDEKRAEWGKRLKSLVRKQAKEDIKEASMRDFTGIEIDNKYINIMILYNKFISDLNKINF